MNQLSIRMASSGLLEMYTDFLEFDVTYSYEVARCIRGRTVNGQPDYLVNAPLPLTLATAANPTPTTLWCDWTGTAFSGDGGAPDAAMPGAPDAGASPGRWDVDNGRGSADSPDTLHGPHRLDRAVSDLPGREIKRAP